MDTGVWLRFAVVFESVSKEEGPEGESTSPENYLSALSWPMSGRLRT